MTLADLARRLEHLPEQEGKSTMTSKITVTDEMVQAAMDAAYGLHPLTRMWPGVMREAIKAALDAAPTAEDTVTADDLVPVSWTDCDCEWGTSYCDEYHRRTTRIPRSVLARAARDARGQG